MAPRSQQSSKNCTLDFIWFYYYFLSMRKTNNSTKKAPLRKAKDCIILAVYLNVGNLDAADVYTYVEKTRKEIEGANDKVKLEGVVHYFIPVRDGDTRIEKIHDGRQ